MKVALLCLCLVSTACAVPFQYLSQYLLSEQQQQPAQGGSPFPSGFPQLPQLGLPRAYSVEAFYPYGAGAAAGANPAQPFSPYGLIKVSIPQPPGRQSVEILLPYDFNENRVMQNIPPMSNRPVMQDVFPLEYPPQNVPQQTMIKPSLDAKAVPSQDPLQPVLQDQPTQASQVLSKV